GFGSSRRKASRGASTPASPTRAKGNGKEGENADKVKDFSKPGEEREAGARRSRSRDRERRRKERGKSKERKTDKK
ncbi:hypothetical protein M9458_004346, partial [Cirrhinus mrigala]